MDKKMKIIGSLGAGRMGRGIAIAFAYAGHRIALVDLRERTPEAWQALADAARCEIRDSLQGLAHLGAMDAGLGLDAPQAVEGNRQGDAPAALAAAVAARNSRGREAYLAALQA